MAQYIVYADGACSGNPGPGGWAFEIQGGLNTGLRESIRESGGSPQTTNNMMELIAATSALHWILNTPGLVVGEIILCLDSQYVLDGLFKWINSWKAKGWKTSSRKPIKNRELWETLDAVRDELLRRGFTFNPKWVKGHSGEPGNERVDTEAQRMRDAYALPGSNPAPQPAMQPTQSSPAPISGQVIGANPHCAVDDIRMTMSRAAKEANPGEDVNQMQVDLMRAILEGYTSGHHSIRDVVREVRNNAIAFGCR